MLIPVTFSYPYHADEQEAYLELPAPELYETDTIKRNIKWYRTISGNIKIVPIDIFEDGKITYYTLLNFEHICYDKIEEARKFFINAQNHYIRYIDYNGEEWISLLSMETFQITKQNRDEYGNFSITIYRWKP